MDVGKTDRSRSVPRRKQVNPSESHLRSPLLPSEKNNGGTPTASTSCARKLRPREIVPKYKSGNISSLSKSSATQQKQPRSSSPATFRRDSGLDSSQLPKRSLSAERRQPSSSFSRSSSSRPSTPSSLSKPSSTPSSHSRPSTPSSHSRPSTPLSHSRPSTPARDSVLEGHGISSSRRSVGVRTMMDGLWPSTRNVTTSSNSRSTHITTCEKEKSVASLDQASKSSSESMKTPLRRRNAPNANQSENSKPIRNSDKQGSPSYTNNWISMMSSRSSSPAAMTRSLDLTDKITKSRTRTSSPSSSNPLRSRSPVVRIPNNSSPPYKPLPRSISDGDKLSVLSKASLHPQLPPCKIPFPSSSSRPVTPSSSRPRPSTPSPSSVRSYIVDTPRKGKKNSNHIDNIHQLRLLHNQYMQWRIINARTEATMFDKKITAESVIYSVWASSSELLVKVITKKIKLQQIRQEIKLYFVFKQQLAYLEEWAALDKEHGGLLSKAAEVLKASIIRLPVTGRAKADVLSVKDAFGSAVDVTQFLGSSIYTLRKLVEDTNSLVSELASVSTTESYMLDECTELLASTAAMQVQELSLRTHLVQLKQDMLVVDYC
ncbi:hypothetical protein ZOSMA_132G00400 [Zostera marina]|uniref:Uncharacterized protein n=1 Tax=Zostera marina TaxID=29655 RepID=A0A0K9Q194_ZOSMR|nr:hypothetical protein ZOSMA_132G00400 [Zostera marina]